jgi:hypothetical protein
MDFSENYRRRYIIDIMNLVSFNLDALMGNDKAKHIVCGNPKKHFTVLSLMW